ncbi:MAG TPA: hypothetical protein VD993_18985 [Chitinophagaceae bacterium]|nr:hypothetical protein [Chitinophagaceae bacterium]
MKNLPSRNITIYLSLNQEIFKGYFNPQDPSPIYKRQLSHEFEQYIMTCIRSAKRNCTLNYKISYKNEQDKQFAEPLMYAIRRHFGETRSSAMESFEKFKRRTYKLLFLSLTIVIMCQGFLPLVLKSESNRLQYGILNSADVLCWVILWKPIERLIFYWNPYLKEISIMDKLQKAEVVVTEVQG